MALDVSRTTADRDLASSTPESVGKVNSHVVVSLEPHPHARSVSLTGEDPSIRNSIDSETGLRPLLSISQSRESSDSRQPMADDTQDEFRNAALIKSTTLRMGAIRSTWVSRVLADTWIPELIGLTISVASFSTLISLFVVYQHQAVAQWPAKLSFATVVVILSRASQLAIAIPISSCLGQIGWIRYRGRKRRAALDVQRFDAATRGPLGIIRLLWTAPSFLVFLSFMIALAGLGFEAAAQQCLDIQGPTKIPRAVNLSYLNSTPPWIAPNAIRDGLFFEGLRNAALGLPSAGYRWSEFEFGLGALASPEKHAPEALQYHCNGKCKPPSYPTLDLCSECQDITNQLAVTERYATLPGGHFLDLKKSAISMNAPALVYDNHSSTGPLTLANFTMIQSLKIGKKDPTNSVQVAQRCLLRLCVNIYQLNLAFGSTAVDGASESLLHSFTESRQGHSNWSFSIPPDKTVSNPDQPILLRFVPNSFSIDRSSVEAFSSFFSRLLTGSDEWDDVPGTPVSSGFGASLGAQKRAPFEMWNVLSAERQYTGFPDLASASFYMNASIVLRAHYMGDWIRTYAYNRLLGGPNPMYKGWYWNVWSIRWGWIAIPASVEVLTCLLLALTISKTYRLRLPIWKVSAMATMFRGPAEPESEEFPATGNRVSDMEALAEQFNVRLTSTKSGYRLLSTLNDESSIHGVPMTEIVRTDSHIAQDVNHQSVDDPRPVMVQRILRGSNTI